MKILYLFIIGISLVIFTISFYFYYFFLIPINFFELYSNVNISETSSIGFDLNSSALTFGVLSQYSTSLRAVTITNTNSFPLIVKISSSGTISELLAYPSKEYLLPNSNVSIPITVYSQDKSAGFYDGKIIVKLFRANYG